VARQYARGGFIGIVSSGRDAASVREACPAGEAANARTSGSGWRARLCDFFDTLVLALAVAAPGENGELLDPEYAEAMLLVFDEYFHLRSERQHDENTSTYRARRGGAHSARTGCSSADR
jgi:hypothetical protein